MEKFTLEKDGIPASAVIDENEVKTRIKEMNKRLRRNDDPDAVYKELVEQHNKEQQEIIDLANSMTVPLQYRDFWFAWKYDTDEYYCCMRRGFKFVAERYIQLLRENIMERARQTHTMNEFKKREKEEVSEAHKLACKEVVERNKAALDAGWTLIEGSRLFSDCQFLKDVIVHLGVAMLKAEDDKFERDKDYHTILKNALAYHESMNERYEAAIGRENVWKLLEKFTGTNITWGNCDKDIDTDRGIMYARVEEGELKFIKVA